MSDNVPGGYNGKILRVNLSGGVISEEVIDNDIYRKYLGGAGFIIYYLWKELQKDAEPLGPDNKLIFATGPLTGLTLPGSGRNCAGAKSPLTGGIAKCEGGGFWGAELKRAGFDVIIIEGKAECPVYLHVHDGEAAIREAGHIWGQNVKETQETIRVELDDKRAQVASIGKAGENQVLYACIMNGLNSSLGRGGLGAVMGSKNLKAVAIRGTKMPPLVHSEKVTELRKWMQNNMALVKGFSDFGTGGGMVSYEAIGNLPVRNFRDGLFADVKEIDARSIKEKVRTGMEGCFACPVRCKKVVELKDHYSVDPAYGGPEYETLASLGSNCGIDNLPAICKGNELCNAYSLDTISAGNVISFAMECFENGILTKKDTGNIALNWGNAEAMLKLIELISEREGIGDLLADGVSRASKKLNNGAQKYAMHAKGLEPGMHDPRCNPGLGLGYAVNPHGADHAMNVIDFTYNSPDKFEEFEPLGFTGDVPVQDLGQKKVALLKLVQEKRLIFDTLVLCMFLPYSFQQVADTAAGVTGLEMDADELVRIADRILTTARLFNLREGFTAADDSLPQRFFQPKTDGVLSDKAIDAAEFDKARSYYYTLMGWDGSTGVPDTKKLKELGIE